MRTCILYPADPLGVIPGGIDTFIRGVLRWAPDDLKISLVGVTTDPESRPVGKWIDSSIGGRDFDFFPLIHFRKPGEQPRFPLTARFVLALLRRRLRIDADVLEFHRIEPAIPFLRDRRPKNLVMHQNMNVIRNRDSDIRWKRMPGLYFLLEKFIIRRVQSVFCVREDAVQSYREQYKEVAHKFHFTPTWFDTDTFSPPSDVERNAMRRNVASEHGFRPNDKLLIWVGRMDSQKNPLLLVRAFERVRRAMPDTRLLMIGDGVLRKKVEQLIIASDLKDDVILCGIRSSKEVANLLKACDAFVLPSAYEGMPISILEALGSGLPVVATDVGEIARVVSTRVNGELVSVQAVEEVAAAIQICLQNSEKYRGEPCYQAVRDYMPEKILAPIYENYRLLAQGTT